MKIKNNIYILGANRRISIPKWMLDELGVNQTSQVEIMASMGELVIKLADLETVKEREYLGIIRGLERQGRTTIPVEWCKSYDCKIGDKFIFTLVKSERSIHFRNYEDEAQE